MGWHIQAARTFSARVRPQAIAAYNIFRRCKCCSLDGKHFGWFEHMQRLERAGVVAHTPFSKDNPPRTPPHQWKRDELDEGTPYAIVHIVRTSLQQKKVGPRGFLVGRRLVFCLCRTSGLVRISRSPPPMEIYGNGALHLTAPWSCGRVLKMRAWSWEVVRRAAAAHGQGSGALLFGVYVWVGGIVGRAFRQSDRCGFAQRSGSIRRELFTPVRTCNVEWAGPFSP